MAVLLNPPGETPPAEGSIGEAHEERADGGLWEHPGLWAALIVIGALVVAGFFLARRAKQRRDASIQDEVARQVSAQTKQG